MLDGNTDLEDMTVTFDWSDFTLGSLYQFEIKEDLPFDVIAKRTFTLSFYYNAILRRLSNIRISDHCKSMFKDEIRSIEPKLNWYLYRYFLNHAYYHSRFYNFDFEEFIKCPKLINLKLSLKNCGRQTTYDTREMDLVKGLQISLIHFVKYFDAVKPIDYKYDNPHILLTYINIFGRILEDNEKMPQYWWFIEETPLNLAPSRNIIDDTICRQDDIFRLFSNHIDALKNSHYEGERKTSLNSSISKLKIDYLGA